MSINNQELFYKLVRSGLWAEVETNLLETFGTSDLDRANVNLNDIFDWNEVFLLAEEQSLIGLVLAGIEHSNVKPPQKLLLQWIGEVQILEQQNLAMNKFTGKLFAKLHVEGIKAVLVKGQGVAQCYEKPLWRSCGDIDLLMDSENYERCKDVLIPIAEHVEKEEIAKKHQGLYVKDFLIELHGMMPFGLSKKADGIVDEVIAKTITNYTNGKSGLEGVSIPNADEHVFLVFTHFLRHFFIEGVGLRQVCDWIRLLWTYKDSLNHKLLESRIRKAGLMTEWKMFAALAVNELGLEQKAMPFYDSQYKAKGAKVLERIKKSGNFGHNNDLSYRTSYSGLKYKIVAFWRRLKDFISLTYIFPIDAPRFFMTYIMRKV